MSFDVAIKITSEADLKALKLSEEATRKVGEELKKLNGASASSSAGGAAQGIEKTAVAAEKLGSATRPLNQALNLLAPQLGLLGPIGNAAGNALLGLTNGLGAMTLAGGAAVIGIQAFANSMQQADKEAANFSKAIQTKDLGFFTDNLERLRAIQSDRASDNIFITGLKTIGGLFGDSDRLVGDLSGKIADYNAQLKNIDASRAREVTDAFRLQADAIGTGPIGKIGVAARQQIADLGKAFSEGKIGAQEYRAALAGVGEVRSASITEFNRGLTDQINLLKAANDPLAQIEIRMQSLRRGADTGTLGNLGELQRLQETAAKIAAGAPLVSQGFAQIGAAAVLPKSKLDELAVSAFALDQKFQAGLITAKQYTEGLKGIAAGALDSSSQTLLKRISDIRSDLGGLAGQQFTGANEFESLLGKLQGIQQAAREKFGLDIPPEVISRLQEVSSKVQEIAGEKKLTLDTTSFSVQIEAANEKSDLLFNRLRTPLEIQADDQVSAAVDAAIARVRALRAEAASPVQLIVDVSAQGSPRMSFSNYFDDYAPGVVEKFGQDAGRRGAINIDSGLAQTVSMLQSSIGQNMAALNDPNNIGWGHIGAVAAGQIRGAQASLSFIREAAGLEPNDVLGARRASGASIIGAPAASGGSIGGGGGVNGDVNITINIQGALTQEVLDRELLPKFEGVIREATGKSPNYRVLN